MQLPCPTVAIRPCPGPAITIRVAMDEGYGRGGPLPASGRNHAAFARPGRALKAVRGGKPTYPPLRMLEALETLETTALAELAAVSDADALEAWRLAYLGNSGKLTLGRRHIIMRVRDELVEVFARMGFEVAEGPELEDDEHNFIKLNIPPEHPARDPIDNFYVDNPDGGQPRMLRSQTSTVQIRVMEKAVARGGGLKSPIKIVSPGRVYRPDTVDATHSFMFHQIEGLYIDRGVTMSDLKTTLLQFARAYFGPDAEIRLRPSFFPFTEPIRRVRHEDRSRPASRPDGSSSAAAAWSTPMSSPPAASTPRSGPASPSASASNASPWASTASPTSACSLRTTCGSLRNSKSKWRCTPVHRS
jgi:hypothetical protein